MTISRNIFNNLVTNEDSTTQLLCNLFMIKVFRDKFLSHLNVDMEFIDEVGYENFNTQVTYKNSRPDIVLESKNILLVFEVKTQNNRGLTDSQLSGYKEVFDSYRDENFRYKALIFITPKNYAHEQEIDNIKSKLINRYNVITTNWESIIELIEENELQNISNYLNDFSELLKSWYIPQPITFKTMEIQSILSEKTPSALLKLLNVVEVINSLSHSYNPKIRRSSDWSEYGIYFRNNEDKDILFFGVWLEAWIKQKKPLCIAVDKTSYSKKVVSEFSKFTNGKYIEVQGWLCASPRDEMLEEESVAESIWEHELKPLLDKLIST